MSKFVIKYKEDASQVGYLPLRPNPSVPPPVIPITGVGDMFRSVYDQNGNGVPDSADNVTITNVAGLQDALNDLANQGGGGGGGSIISVTNSGSDTFSPGIPVCKIGSMYMIGSSVSPRHNILGLAVDISGPGDQLKIQSGGIIQLSPENWDIVTGQVGGLSTNAIYYVNSLSRVSPDAPTLSPEYLVKIGVALNNTELLIDLDLIIRL